MFLTQRHRDTKAQRVLKLGLCPRPQKLCVSESLCLCVKSICVSALRTSTVVLGLVEHLPVAHQRVVGGGPVADMPLDGLKDPDNGILRESA